MSKALRRSPRLAPFWIALALIICVGLGGVGIARRINDPFREIATSVGAALPPPLAGEVLRDLAGARSASTTWPRPGGATMKGVVAFIVGVADLAGEIIARESISLRLANIAEHQAQLDGFARARSRAAIRSASRSGNCSRRCLRSSKHGTTATTARGAMVRRRVRAVANGARQRRRRDETRGRAFARVDDRSRL
jgi:hypothetical protein